MVAPWHRSTLVLGLFISSGIQVLGLRPDNSEDKVNKNVQDEDVHPMTAQGLIQTGAAEQTHHSEEAEEHSESDKDQLTTADFLDTDEEAAELEGNSSDIWSVCKNLCVECVNARESWTAQIVRAKTTGQRFAHAFGLHQIKNAVVHAFGDLATVCGSVTIKGKTLGEQDDVDAMKEILTHDLGKVYKSDPTIQYKLVAQGVCGSIDDLKTFRFKGKCLAARYGATPRGGGDDDEPEEKSSGRKRRRRRRN